MGTKGGGLSQHPSDEGPILVEGQGLFVVLWNVLAVVWKPRERLERVVNHDY